MSSKSRKRRKKNKQKSKFYTKPLAKEKMDDDLLILKKELSADLANHSSMLIKLSKDLNLDISGNTIYSVFNEFFEEMIALGAYYEKMYDEKVHSDIPA